VAVRVREAWLHTLCLDFAGARLLCEALMRSREDVPSTQPQTIARLSGGYIELEHGRLTRQPAVSTRSGITR